jgi:pSer/pThr/pTyr-binding forkhead associated (FHA) protein
MDLASREGTTLNGEAVKGEAALLHGDKIGLGSCVILEYLEGTRPGPITGSRWLRRLGWVASAALGIAFLLRVVR